MLSLLSFWDAHYYFWGKMLWGCLALVPKVRRCGDAAKVVHRVIRNEGIPQHPIDIPAAVSALSQFWVGEE
jgi:hypothetical protein